MPTATGMDTAIAYVDADGHVIEHPTELPAYARRELQERVWHVEVDKSGAEWIVFDGHREPAAIYVGAASAGFSDAEKQRLYAGEMKYSELRNGAFDADARLHDMDADRIDRSVLYPTHFLALHDYPDKSFATAMCSVYNDWISDHCSQGDGRLDAVAVLPQWDIDATVAELRRVATKPHIVGGFMRPSPMIDWKPFFDSVYDPLWTAACDTGCAIGFHPLLTAGVPGACAGLHLDNLDVDTPWTRGEINFRPALPGMEMGYNNHFFAQGISNPVDMMTAIAFMTGGDVFERFPDLRIVFLESNGGWIVPFLERLDHHAREFAFDVPWLTKLPSEHFRRNCWISFDPDESTLAFTANSPLVGADRIVWASDYPHPDAKFPGTVSELDEATESLSYEQRRLIAGANTAELYGITL